MGVNATTSVPVYSDGEILEASRLNVTNSGVPVFATTTTRDAAFGGTGEKVLAEGQMAYIENIPGSSAVQFYDGAAWSTLTGLTLVKTQTIGSGVSTVTVTGAFSAAYDNYKIVIANGVGSTNLLLNLKLGASATGYYNGGNDSLFASPSAGTANTNNGANWTYCGAASTGHIMMSLDLLGPFLAKNTILCAAEYVATTYRGSNGGYHASAVSYSDFTVTTSTGTITGGDIRVYGYANS